MKLALPDIGILKDKSWWADAVFYFMLAVLIVVVFCYGIITIKAYYQEKKIVEIDQKIASYSTPEEKARERRVISYKVKIDDFINLLSAHKINSSVFAFIEANTLSTVSFSNFSMTDASGDMRMTGEAPNMDTLSKQFKIFEAQKDYIRSITVLNTQITPTGKLTFNWSIVLDPKVFTYTVTGNQTQTP